MKMTFTLRSVIPPKSYYYSPNQADHRNGKWHAMIMTTISNPLLAQYHKGANSAVIDKRFETINEHQPDFVAIGRAGFSGYVVFGFPSKNTFVLESTEINNATYIFDDSWESLSQKTKAEVLNEDLHKHRVIHRESWFSEVAKILT